MNTIKLVLLAVIFSLIGTAMVMGQIPTGTIAAFGGEQSQIPHGWLLCNGDILNKSNNPQLYKAIGIAWGKGDGTLGSFNLPNLQGLFLRGVNGRDGRDPDAEWRVDLGNGGNTGNNVGSLQQDALQIHQHQLLVYPKVIDETNETSGGASEGYPSAKVDSINTTGPLVPADNSPPAMARSATETRPVNAYVYYIIKR